MISILAASGPEVGLAHHVLFGAGGETSVHPAMIVAVVAAICLILTLPRRYVLAPLIFLSILSPLGQRVMIGPFHFQIFRIVLGFACVRLLWMRYGQHDPSFEIKLNIVDKAIIFYSLSSIATYTLLWQDSSAFFDEVGKTYNVLGFYLVFRGVIRSKDDVERVIKILSVVACCVAAVMLNEQITGRNVLGIFGAAEYTPMRDGYLRSQGPFTVYLTAGAFGATLLPLFLCLWHKHGSRVFAAIGIIGAITICITSRTSTAISACLAALVGLVMWPCRNKMRLVRWGIVFVLVALHLSMKAPVWALVARIDIVGGSTGWHRFKIIDNFVRHFWDWCLLGSNNYWTWDGGDDMWDTANQYVFIGENNGLIPLSCFIVAVVYCFKYLGRARKIMRQDTREQWFLWLLGVTLFANLIAFIGIAYSDQVFIYWYALLAMIVAGCARLSSDRIVSNSHMQVKVKRSSENADQAQLEKPEATLFA